MKYRHVCTRILVLLLAFSICGTAELAQALQTAPPAQSGTASPQSTSQDQQTPTVQNPPTTPGDLPNAPSTNSTQPAGQATTPAPSTPTTVIFPGGEQSTPAQDQSQTGTQTQQQPLGTAAAEKGVTRGGAASRPAGTAIAGTKQRQSRSLLIKLGAVAAAGVALGTVYALTKGTSSTPPGAVR